MPVSENLDNDDLRVPDFRDRKKVGMMRMCSSQP
jgi:hypothetical protein